MLHINDRIKIPEDQLQFSYARSPGAGGQNVNKLSTKAILHWNLEESAELPDDVRERFLKHFGNRINQRGEFVIQSSRFRQRERNIRDCRQKLRDMLAEVAKPPKRRIPTKPTKSSKRRRLEAKRKQSEKKKWRKPPSFD